MIVTLNNFTLNNTGGTTNYTYLDEPIDGLSLPPIRTSSGNYSGRDGGYVGAQFYGARLITLTGRIFAPDVTTLDTTRQSLAAALSTGTVTMYVTTNSGKQYLINCYLDSLDMPIQKAPLQQAFKISLIAADPNIYDNSTSGAMSTPLQIAVGGGITWPISWSPTSITWAPGAQPAVVNNTGQLLIYPVITLSTTQPLLVTNYVANPSFETGTTGWSAYVASTVGRFIGDGQSGGTGTIGSLNFTAAGNVGMPYVNIGTAFTLSAWFNLSVTGLVNMMSYMSTLLRVSDTGVTWWADYNGVSVNWTSTNSINNWHHVVIVQNGTTATAYIDGTSLGSLTTVTPNTASGTNALGGFGGTNNFNGKMADIQVHSRTVSGAEVTSLYNKQAINANALTLQYFTQDGSGTTVTDSSGNGRNGTVSGTVGWSTSGVTPNIAALRVVSAGALSGGYAGLAQYTITGLTSGNTYTLSAYLKGVVAGTSNAASLYVVSGSTTSNVALTIGTSWQQTTNTFVANGTTATIYVRTTDLTFTALIDAVMVADGSWTTYFDGNTATTSSIAYAWTSTANASTSTRTLTGTGVSSPTIKNQTTGQFFTLSGLTTTPSDVIVIDMYNRTVLLNGGSILPFVTTQSTWWSLIPGNNNINLTTNNTTDLASGVISWRAAYRSL